MCGGRANLAAARVGAYVQQSRRVREPSPNRSLVAGATPLGISDEAYRLRAKAEHWQAFAAQQQALASELRELARQQRDLASGYAEGDAVQLLAGLYRVEEELRALSEQVLGLEKDALDRMANAIADEARALEAG